LSFVERWSRWHRGLAWVLVVAILAVRLFRGLVVAELVSPKVLSSGRIFIVVTVAGSLLWIANRGWYAHAVRAGRFVQLLLGFSMLWLLPELVWMALHPEPHETAGFSKPIAQPPQRRIVWILLDEASQDQIFDHVQPGIAYPNFDRFAQSAVHFTNVQPAGYFTEKVIPSLFTGDIITGERSDLDGRLFVRTEKNHRWHLYPDHSTLFAEAKQEGWSTAAVGWYNPYCRTDAAELDHCYWTLTTPLPGRYDPDRTALQNAAAPVAKSLLRMVGRRIQDPTPWQIHAADYRVLLQHAREEIADRGGFVFIHLPVPHPGGIYNRRTHQVGVDGSYLDNLVLADETFGTLLQAIDATPLADRTTVIISSDHSWRVNLWRPTTDWRAEDTRVSANRFDPRPLLLVRFPGEREGAKISSAFPLIDMHAMIQAMLAGRIRTAAELQVWTGQQ
ncbi:MAG TPA: sulfatase-like hydrolase/transferase, partial [Acidobacteriaceae bacterium]|nr:sulfatase-like hydrolase/transferase [Acidobacteriaceae bacterium]